MRPKSILPISAQHQKLGMQIQVGTSRQFKINYPPGIWNNMPPSIKELLLENITYASTNFLPVMLNKRSVIYDMRYPLFESILHRNQLYDMLFCEVVDNVKQLTYVKRMYNHVIQFASRESTLPNGSEIPKFASKKPTAVIPFSFGKESILTLAVSQEMGIEPILVYCQEPTHAFEESAKVEKLQEMEKRFRFRTHFIVNEPGLFRYGKAFQMKKETELGWGTQTTLLALLSVPFVFASQAQFILFGSEHANNEFDVNNGWKIYSSYDQMSFWTPQQSAMVKLITNSQTLVHSMLEPLEELTIFYILHHRYPQYSSYQFSCYAQKPLYMDTQWCHVCEKCFKNYLFSLVAGIDPLSIGFKKNLLTDENVRTYFLSFKKHFDIDLEFCLYVILKSEYAKKLSSVTKKKMKGRFYQVNFYLEYYFRLKNFTNLPPQFAGKMLTIFKEELKKFRNQLSFI